MNEQLSDTQIQELQALLGYDDGTLFENVNRYVKYSENEISKLRAGGNRVVKYAQRLQEFVTQDKLMKIGLEEVASK